MSSKLVVCLFLFFSCGAFSTITAQDSWLNAIIKEGKPCPDFVLTNVRDNNQNVVTLKSLKGKPFVLDFFSTGCTSCFASFSEVNKLNKKYSDQVKIIIVGRDDKYIRNAYATFKIRQNLTIPYVFDTITVNKFHIFSFPYVIWVDANGIISAVTTGSEWTDENVISHAMGKTFDHGNRDEGLQRYVSFDIHRPFAFDAAAWKDSLFYQRSLITSWKREMGNAAQPSFERYAEIGIPVQVVGWPLVSLYRLAYLNRLPGWVYGDTIYYGKYCYEPIYEVADSSVFQFDWNLEHNKFCYSQVLARHKGDTAEMRRIMREDLYNAFGYTATIETRNMPYLRLVKIQDNDNQLKSQSTDTLEESFIDGVNFKNVQISQLVFVISYKADLVSKDLPLIDETGIDYPIDIKFSASMTDINDVIKELPNHGLKIVPGVKEMKVLVIRDGKNNL